MYCGCNCVLMLQLGYQMSKHDSRVFIFTRVCHYDGTSSIEEVILELHVYK